MSDEPRGGPPDSDDGGAHDHRASTRPAGATWVALGFHAPGLWWWYRRRLGPRTRQHNVVAIGLTVAAMVLAGLVTRDAVVVAATWALGHLAWGAWLAVRVRRDLDGL